MNPDGLALVRDKHRVTKLIGRTHKPHIYSYRSLTGSALWLWVGEWRNELALFCDHLDEVYGYETD